MKADSAGIGLACDRATARALLEPRCLCPFIFVQLNFTVTLRLSAALFHFLTFYNHFVMGQIRNRNAFFSFLIIIMIIKEYALSQQLHYDDIMK